MSKTQAQKTTKPKPRTMPNNAPAPTAEVTVEELDELLDEIDTVLEENAWVTHFVQKGGE